MNGVRVIAKKEISDFVSNRAYQLTLIILLIGMIIAGTSPTIQSDEPANRSLTVFRNEAIIVTTLGALVAIAYGFNTINKERVEGSLKILLSYPIFRDQIILGKLLGGLMIISIITIASLSVGFVCFIVLVRLLPSVEMFLRFSTFALFTILFLAGWMGLATFLSIYYRDSKKTLLILMLLVGLLNPEVLSLFRIVVPRLVYGANFLGDQVNVQVVTLSQLINTASPVVGYINLSTRISVLSIFYNGVRTMNPLTDVLMNNIYSIVLLVIIPVLAFSASYVVFTKRDVT